MTNKFLLTSAICAAFMIPVASETVQAQENSSNLIAQGVFQPQINNFAVNSVNQLLPGTELIFTLQGTPNSNATFSIGNVARNLPMQEVEPGIYEGRYVIRNGALITANTPVQATLQRGYQTVSTVLQQPLTNAIAANTNDNLSRTQSLSINRFTLQPAQSVLPGTELNFTLIGTPSAKATFSIEGVGYNLPMRETSRGVYQGQYVVRRQDDFSSSGARVTASLQSGSQVVRAVLDQPLLANTSSSETSTVATTGQQPIEILSPQNNSRVDGTVEVRGRSIPNTPLNVRVQASTSLAGLIGFNREVLNRTVTTDSQGNFSFTFNPTLAVPGTRYEVSLNAPNASQVNPTTLILFQ